MNYFKSLLLTACALVMLAACNNDDLKDDINDLKDRVESLEAQVSLLNDNVTSIKILLEGGKTITNFTESNGTYTLKLSDGQTITLNQGSKGEIKYPDISVNSDNQWVVNGEVLKQNGVPVQAVGATGADGATPEFRVTTDGNFWQVRYSADGVWEDVLDEAGHKVSATSGSDKFFEDVKVSEDGQFFMVKLKDAADYIYVPIVKDVLSEITVPQSEMNNGVWEIAYGKSSTTKVKVKGENIIVTAPAGWTATLSEADPTTNEAVLTVTPPTSPATATSRATADNSLDVTVQANTGASWAVDKIQVKAVDIINSYYEYYMNGGTITVNGMSINKNTYGDATLIEADATKITAGGVYFVKSGINTTYEVGDLADNFILIGDNPSEKSQCSIIRGIALIGDGSKDLIISNMKVDGSSYAYSICTVKEKFRNIIFNNSEFIVTKTKNLISSSVAEGNIVSKIELTNNLIRFNLETDWSASRVINFDKGLNCASVLIDNNCIYSSNINLTINGAMIVASGNSITSNITISNNTFINIFPSSQSLVRGVVSGNITYSNLLLFYNTNIARNTTLLNVEGSTNIGTLSFSDIIFYNKGTAATNLNYFGGTAPTGYPNTKLVIEPNNPFDGGTFDIATGKFVPNADYAGHGASIN